MSAFQDVATKVSELGSLTAGGVSRAAANLLGLATEKAELLSFDQMHERLSAAVKALRGQQTSGAETQTSPFEVARAFLKSYGVPVVFLGCISPVEASIVFSGDARFVANNGPQTSGLGTLTIEQAPIGSGVGLTSPVNLAEGMTTGRDYIIRYVASAADLTQWVSIFWVAQREYSASGGRGRASVGADFTIELLNDQGADAGAYYVAHTDGSTMTGTGSTWVSEGGTFRLTPANPIKVVSKSKDVRFDIPVTSQDWMSSGLLLSFSPTRANQEFRITLSPGQGITSLIEDGSLTSIVPEPPSIVSALGALAAVGFAAARRRGEGR